MLNLIRRHYLGKFAKTQMGLVKLNTKFSTKHSEIVLHSYRVFVRIVRLLMFAKVFGIIIAIVISKSFVIVIGLNFRGPRMIHVTFTKYFIST